MATLGVAALAWGAGCAGSGSVHFIPLGHKKISRTAPLVRHVAPRQCYYWVNDQGDLCVAMRDHRRKGLGKLFQHDMTLSLVLGEPPAGPARTYRATTRTLRSRTRQGFSHTRAASTSGLAAVWDYGKKRLHGRFRIVARQQSFWAPTGWGSDGSTLIIGEFTALAGREAGERILAASEEGELSRPPQDAEPTRMRGRPLAGSQE